LRFIFAGKDGKKKKKNGSNNGSKPTSRSSTPVQNQDQMTSDTLNQAAKSLKDGLLLSLKLSFIPCFLSAAPGSL